MAHKVILIRCGSVFSKGRVGCSAVLPPLGMAYLASCLRQAGYEVGIIDAPGEDVNTITSFAEFDLLGLTNEEIVARIPADVGIIAFSSMFSNEWIYLKELISLAKSKFPTAVTVLGGEHGSALPEYSLDSCQALDYVISGEGEAALVEFAGRIFNRSPHVSTIGGLSYRTPAGAKTNPKKPRIKAVDEIPLPAWDIVPVENYLREGMANLTRKGQRVMPLLASRGCPYECKFCSNPQIYGNRYYTRDVEEVVREIRFLKERYRITGFEFHDLTFITNKNWSKEFCRRMIEERFDLTWNIPTTRSEAIDEEVVDLLLKSGCRNITLTPDSGSERMIKETMKKVDLKKITQTAKVILRTDIILRMNIVFGFPNEMHRDVWQSILYGLKLAILGVNPVLFYRFVPYPGSAYFERLRKEGKLPPFGPGFDRFLVRNIYNELSFMRSYSDYLSDRAVRFYMFAGHILTELAYFLFHPSEIFNTISRLIRRAPNNQADLMMMAFFKRRFGWFAETIKS